MAMHTPIEMFGLSPYQSRANHRLDRKAATVGQSPLQHHAQEAIDGVMAWLTSEVVLQAGMALEGEHRRDPERSWR